MENTNSNSKYLTLTFILFSALIGFTISALLHSLSGAFAPIARLSNYDLFKHGIPVVIAFGLFLYLQLNKNVLVWANEVIVEIKKIVWPPIKDTRAMTVVVIIMVFISSIIISAFDLFSGFALNQLIK
jgi:preprotein translocase SecE subunit